MGALEKRTINYRSALGIMPLAALLPLPVFRRKGNDWTGRPALLSFSRGSLDQSRKR